MIKNKTILMCCKETYSPPLFILGEELKKNNNNIHYFLFRIQIYIKINSQKIFILKLKKIDEKSIHHVGDIDTQIIKKKKL